MTPNTIILNITPQTWVSFNRNETSIFRIPEQCPLNCGLPRCSPRQPKVKVSTMKRTHPDLWEALGGDDWKPRKKKKEIRYGCPHSLSESSLSKKRRIQRYIAYKERLRELAAEKHFELPNIGAKIIFFIPMPVRWTKTTKRHKHMTWHDNTPDLSNFIKSLEDSLRKQDKQIAYYAGLGKKWVNFEQGWIEITLPSKDELAMYGIADVNT